MPVKCINQLDQLTIASCYTKGHQSVEELAQYYGTSTRTIYRVLFETGVNKSPMRKPRIKQATVVPQPSMLHINKVELTFIEKVQCMFKAIFWRTPKQTDA